MALVLSMSGCVRDAVLENDIRSAVLKERVLKAQMDWEVAEAALAAQLVELEALHQRAPRDARLGPLLVRNYSRLAHGFIEARRLEAAIAGDRAEEARQQARQREAEARCKFYSANTSGAPASIELLDVVQSPLRAAQAACAVRDRSGYERELARLLAAPAATSAEGRLDLVLAQRLAKSWLMPEVSARCGFR